MKMIDEEQFDVVVHAWLKAEWVKRQYDHHFPQHQPLIDSPDFSNRQHNDIRLQLLQQARGNILMHIPPGTRWYVAAYEPEDLSRTYHIASGAWLPITSGNYRAASALLNFDSDHDHASWIRQVHATLPNADMDTMPIVVATSLESPMSILEGNHRAAALLKYDEANPSARLLTQVHVGLSPNMSQNFWHIEHPRSAHLITSTNFSLWSK
jgi:hypothetical protein